MTSSRAALERFLDTDPADIGCGQAMEILHVYVDLVAADHDAGSQYRGVAAHLAACGPCGEDYQGLLAAVSGDLRDLCCASEISAPLRLATWSAVWVCLAGRPCRLPVFGLGDGQGGVDQADVAEGLGEVAEQLPLFVDLLGQ